MNDSIYVIFLQSENLGMMKRSVVDSGQGLEERLTTMGKHEGIWEDRAVLLLSCGGGLRLCAFVKAHKTINQKERILLYVN